MEIEISLSRLLLVIALILVVLAGVIGYRVSPFVGGRPVLLDRQNYAIKQYLDRAGAWAEAMETAGSTLRDLIPPAEEGGEERGEAYPTPIARPGDLYGRARTAREAQEALLTVKREVEQTAVPETMVGLHGLVINAVDAHLALGQAVLDLIGAPGGEPAARAAAQRAQEALGVLQEALAQQEALLQNE